MLQALINSKELLLIFAGIIVILAVVFEVSFQIGRFNRTKVDAANKAEVSTIQITILGILGLLLAFTFSMAATRFDLRQQFVVEEVNAISTTYLRAQLLPEPQKDAIQNLLRQYVDTRIEAVYGGKLRESLAKSEVILGHLWSQTVSIDQKKIAPVILALFVNSLNSVIDLNTSRVSALEIRVPALILLLLLACGGMATVVTGYGCGLRNRRNIIPVSMILLLLAIVLIMIIDLNQPKAGFIRVRQQSMINLQQDLKVNPLIK